MTPMNSMTAHDISAAQLDMLRKLIARLLDRNAFQTPRLRQAGVDEQLDSLAGYVERMPFTTKQALVDDQAAHPPYGTNLTQPLARYTRFHQTSGTSASPLRWLDTPDNWQAMLSVWGRVFAASNVGEHDRVLFAFSFGPFIGFWLAFEAAARTGALCLPGGGLSSLARLQLILDHRVTVLCCTPTYAIRLGQAAGEHGLDLRHAAVRTILVAGEPGGSVPATRQCITSLWPGATVADHHGMTEVGPVSYACPARPDVLHIVEPAFLAEVVDPNTLAPVPPGDIGELVLTTLHRIDSPLLRYRTGDLVRVELHRPCPCGSHETALLGGILARADDMLTIRGVNIYPSAIDQIVRSFPDVAEFQAHVRTDGPMTELSLVVEPTASCTDAGALARDIAERCRSQLSLRIGVALAQPNTLPRYEMKARRWVKA